MKYKQRYHKDTFQSDFQSVFTGYVFYLYRYQPNNLIKYRNLRRRGIVL